jgi:fatty-acyl-CoA synthase
VRSGDAAAFSISDDESGEKAVMLVECRESNEGKRVELVERLNKMVLEELGIDCMIFLVHRNSLPRTTSGKLSRSSARRKFLEGVTKEQLAQSSIDLYESGLVRQAV